MNSCGKAWILFWASNGSPICKKYLSILEADANVVLTVLTMERLRLFGDSYHFWYESLFLAHFLDLV